HTNSLSNNRTQTTQSKLIPYTTLFRSRKLLNEARDKAADIINNNRETHKLIAEALLKYETLDAAQIKSIYETGKMPEEQDKDNQEAHALSYDEVKEKMADSSDSE